MGEIYIRDKYIRELSDYGFMCFLGIHLHANQRNIPGGKPGLVTQKIIASELTDNITKTLTRAIISGFENLIENNLISQIDRFHYMVDYQKFCYDKDYFTKIYDYEIYKVMNCEAREKKSGLLKYMAALFSTFNKKSEVGYMPQSYILEDLNKSASTVCKYNDVLTDLGIIGILKSAPHYLSDGRFIRTNNVYYRPENLATAVRCSKYHYMPEPESTESSSPSAT